jgi:hypothetical protein
MLVKMHVNLAHCSPTARKCTNCGIEQALLFTSMTKHVSPSAEKLAGDRDQGGG